MVDKKTKKYLGLDKIKQEEVGDCLRKYLSMQPFIKEGRATFEALVPNRYKDKKDKE